MRISAGYALVNLNRDGVDLAIRYVGQDGIEPGAELLFDDVVLPVCSPKLLRDPARPLKSPEDLRHHVLMYLDSGPGADMQDWPIWLRAMRLDGLKPARVLHFSQFDQLINAAIAGQGVALGRSPLLRQLLRERKLVAPFPGVGRFATQLLPGPIGRRGAQARGAGFRGLVARRGAPGYSKRPGFSRFAGSSARLTARIICNATGDLRSASSSRLSAPMPCSAENEPPCAPDRIEDDGVHRVLLACHEIVGRGTFGRLHVVMQVAVPQRARARRQGDDDISERDCTRSRAGGSGRFGGG